MWQTVVTACAVALLTMGAWWLVRALRPQRAADRLPTLVRAAAALLMGASRFVPDTFDASFWTLLVGVGLLFYSRSAHVSKLGARHGAS